MKYSFRNILNRFFNKQLSNNDENVIELLEKELLYDKSDKLFNNQLHEEKIYNEIFSGIDSSIHKSSNKWMYYKVAAVVVLFIGLGLTYHYSSSEELIKHHEIANNSEYIQTYVLIDGSTIILKQGSSLKYSEKFNDAVRAVELNGEAFFDIKRNEEKPFIITTGNLKTQVLGTSFNIKETNEEVKVSVVTGLVKVFDDVNVIKVKPNQEARYNIKEKDLHKKAKKSIYATMWHKSKVRLKQFNAEGLEEFFKERFDAELIYDRKNDFDVNISVSIFKEDSIEKAIERINQIGDIKLKKTEEYRVELTMNK